MRISTEDRYCLLFLPLLLHNSQLASIINVTSFVPHIISHVDFKATEPCLHETGALAFMYNGAQTKPWFTGQIYPLLPGWIPILISCTCSLIFYYLFIFCFFFVCRERKKKKNVLLMVYTSLCSCASFCVGRLVIFELVWWSGKIMMNFGILCQYDLTFLSHVHPGVVISDHTREISGLSSSLGTEIISCLTSFITSVNKLG